MRKLLEKWFSRIVQALRHLLTPPEFADQEKSAVARLQIQFITPFMLIAPLFAAIAILLAGEFVLRWLGLLGYIWIVGFSSVAIIRHGRPRLAGYLLLSEFWLLITAFAITAGGIRAPIVTGYLVLVLASGLLLGAKAGYLMALISVMTELGLLYLGRIVTLPEAPFGQSDFLIWVADAFHATILAILQHVASRNFRSALHSADRELTGKKRTEMSLRQSEERFARLSQATFEGIIVSEGERVIDVNDQALKMFGQYPDDMMGRNIWEFVKPSGLEPGLSRARSDGEEPQEYLALKRDGGTFPVESRSRSLNVDGHKVRLTTIRDITERRRAELLQNAVYRISQAQDKSASLEELYKAVHEIISTVMPASNFYIALYDDKEDMVSFPYFVDEEDSGFEPHRSGKGLTEYVIRTGKSLMCDEATDRKLSELGEIDLVGTPSTVWIGVPLKVEGVTFGVMAIQHYTDPNAYGEHDLKMLEYVSEQVARAIDRKRSEDASQRERILLRTLVDNLPTPIFVKNREHQRTLVNPAYLRRLRLNSSQPQFITEERILGKTDFDIYPRELAEQYFQNDQRIIGEGVPVLDREEFQFDSDKRPHWESVSRIPMRDESGEVIGLVGIGTDITERKLAEENLRQLNAFNEMLIETFPFGIEIVAENGEVLFLSEKMKALSDVDPLGRTCWEVYRDDRTQCDKCPLRREITIGTSDNFEVSGLLRGRTFQIDHTGLMYNGRKALIEIFQDITENKKLQSQFMQAQKLEGLGNIAAGIAHDFNNILGVILGYAELLSDSDSEIAGPNGKLRSIVDSAQRGKSLVSQLLMFARKTEATFKAVRVNDIIRETERLVKATFPKTIQITTKLLHGLPHVTADPNQLHQVLLNICVNARDAMPGGGTLSISTGVVDGETVSARHHDAAASRYVKMEMSDTGIGMDEATKARVFEPFFSTKDIGKGTGLGLSVVYGIVESHHGFIEVNSELMRGTTISIYFPVEEQPMDLSESHERSTEPVSGGNETVLVIEDEEMLRELLESILTSNGYNVVTAGDGESGVETFRINNNRIAVVMSDLGLPRLSGQEVVGKIKKINPSAKVIVASGYIAPDARAQLEGLRVKAFIQKPYMKQEVLNAVRNAIDSAD